MDIQVTDRFIKHYQKLPQRIKLKAKQQEKIFVRNPFDIRLKTHRLIGKQSEVWSFSINYSYRIIFIFLTKSSVLLLDVGTHEIYK